MLPPLKCNGCRKCCLGDTILIRPDLGDNHKRWKTDYREDGSRVLKKGPDGNCIYLGPKGCKIYGKQPAMCQAYDCRVHYLNVLKHHGQAGVDVRIATGMESLEEGKKRLNGTTDEINS